MRDRKKTVRENNNGDKRQPTNKTIRDKRRKRSLSLITRFKRKGKTSYVCTNGNRGEINDKWGKKHMRLDNNMDEKKHVL